MSSNYHLSTHGNDDGNVRRGCGYAYGLNWSRVFLLARCACLLFSITRVEFCRTVARSIKAISNSITYILYATDPTPLSNQTHNYHIKEYIASNHQPLNTKNSENKSPSQSQETTYKENMTTAPSPTAPKHLFPDGLKTSGQHNPTYDLLTPPSLFPKEISGPTVWKAEDYRDHPERWTHVFSASEVEELGKAADGFIAGGRPLTGMAKVGFVSRPFSRFVRSFVLALLLLRPVPLPSGRRGLHRKEKATVMLTFRSLF